MLEQLKKIITATYGEIKWGSQMGYGEGYIYCEVNGVRGSSSGGHTPLGKTNMEFERLPLSDSNYFLRVDTPLYEDDPGFGPDEKECYSLCKLDDEVGYRREHVYRGPREWAIQQSEEYIENDTLGTS